MSLTRMDKVELALIGLAIVSMWLTTSDIIWTPRFGALLSYVAVLLLGQGLVRDVARLAWRRRKRAGEVKRVGCLCAESTVGLALVTVAAGLTLLGVSETATLGRGALTGFVAAVLLSGFVAKDYVVIVRKEKDHASVITW